MNKFESSENTNGQGSLSVKYMLRQFGKFSSRRLFSFQERTKQTRDCDYDDGTAENGPMLVSPSRRQKHRLASPCGQLAARRAPFGVAPRAPSPLASVYPRFNYRKKCVSTLPLQTSRGPGLVDLLFFGVGGPIPKPYPIKKKCLFLKKNALNS